MVLALPEASYLDDKPIGSNEREVANAWKEGGLEAEKAKRIEVHRAQTRPLEKDPEWEERKAKLAEQQRRALARILVERFDIEPYSDFSSK